MSCSASPPRQMRWRSSSWCRSRWPGSMGRGRSAFQPGRSAPGLQPLLPSLAPLNENADPGIKYFSGEATYTKELHHPARLETGPAAVARSGRGARIGGSFGERQSRGHCLACALPGRYRRGDQGRAQPACGQSGEFVGQPADRRCPAGRRRRSPIPPCQPTAPMRRCGRSGLIGPVELLGQGQVGPSQKPLPE